MADIADQIVSRRRFIKVTVGAAGTMAVAASGVAAAKILVERPPTNLRQASVSAPAPSSDAVVVPEAAVETFGLEAGQTLGRWQITSVAPVRRGSIRIGMSTQANETFEVDVVRRGFGDQALASTRHFSVVLVNNGTGDTRSDEEQGCGAIMVGRYLAVQERNGLTPPAELLSYNARRRAFPEREAGRRLA